MPDEAKTCPECAEDIKAAAVVCRYCGHRFEASPGARSPSTETRPPSPIANSPLRRELYAGSILRVAAVLLALVFGAALMHAGGPKSTALPSDTGATSIQQLQDQQRALGQAIEASKRHTPAYYAGAAIIYGVLLAIVAGLVVIAVRTWRGYDVGRRFARRNDNTVS